MSRLKHLLDKLAVATDDRLSTAQCWLSTAQLMLTNNDLRPGQLSYYFFYAFLVLYSLLWEI